MSFDVDALISKARAAVDVVSPTDQEVLLGGEVVTVRFWPLSGPAWRDLVAPHPARDGSPRDLGLGYNLDAVVPFFPKVFLVHGDEVVNVAGEKWAEICGLLEAPDLNHLAVALWGMHEFDPQRRMDAAKKASKGQPRKKRSSPSSSKSQSGN